MNSLRDPWGRDRGAGFVLLKVPEERRKTVGLKKYFDEIIIEN